MKSGMRTLEILTVGLTALAIAGSQAPAADCVLNDGRLKPEGAFIYNHDFKVMQYCDGTRWRTMLGGGIVDPGLADLTDVDDALGPGNGDCLVYSSAAGEWQSQSCAAAAGGDDLGDHTADQNIILGTHWLSGDGGSEGISISASGTGTLSTNASGQIFAITTASTGNSFLRVQNGITSANFGIGSTLPHPYLWSGSGNLSIGNDGAPVLMIEGMAGATGNIGIRTSDPTVPLDVNGAARIAGALDMSNQKITALAAPTVGTDAATKAYVDGLTGANEIDPQVNAVTNGQWCRGDGSSVQCDQTAPVAAEADPQVGALTASKWCISNAAATAIVCNQNAPAASPSCVRRSTVVAASSASRSCNAGEIMTGGGCNANAQIADTYPSAADTWTCAGTGATSITVYVICCTF